MKELAPGIWHWTAPHPNIGIEVSSYWIPELQLLLDPLAVPDEVDGRGLHPPLLPPPRARLLEAAERFDATIQAPRTGMHDFGDDTPIQPYDFGDPLVDGAVDDAPGRRPQP